MTIFTGSENSQRAPLKWYMLRQICDRVLWLEKGDLKMIDPTEDVLKVYRRHRRLAAE